MEGIGRRNAPITYSPRLGLELRGRSFPQISLRGLQMRRARYYWLRKVPGQLAAQMLYDLIRIAEQDNLRECQLDSSCRALGYGGAHVLTSGFMCVTGVLLIRIWGTEWGRWANGDRCGRRR